MANYYVWDQAVGSADGSSWANAFVTLQAAVVSPRVAGDVFFVAHDHVQTQATALTITSPGTEANPQKVFCVNRAGSVPPVSADLRTTGRIETTGASTLALAGTVSECYGIQFTAGSSTALASLSISNSRSCRLVNCLLKLGGSTSTSRINLGVAGGQTVLEGCTLQFVAVGHAIVPIGKVVMRNCVVSGAFVPNTLFASAASTMTLFAEGCDFSLVTPGSKALFLATGTVGSSAILKDCKLGASVAVFSGSVPTAGALNVALIRCDSGDTNYRTERYDWAGGQLTDNSIFRTGGASDGTTPISWLVANNTASSLIAETFPISIWNETIGSAVTITLQGIWGGGATPTNDKIWMECQYLGTSGFPIASKVSSGLADGLATPANYAAGSGTWSGSTMKFAMSCTFTPQEKGPITIYVKTANAAGAIYWIDPKPVIS